MGRINLKTDYKDGQVLYGNELNVNNNVTMLGVNDNFDRISKLDSVKADSTYVDNALSNKADLAVVNTKIQEINLLKADKTALATKADQSEVDLKASKAELSAGLQTKADLNYVDANLANKVSKKEFNDSLNSKADKNSIGDLDDLNTEDKSNLVNAINSLNRETLPIATTESLGAVKPDGVTVTVDIDGTIHAVGGGGSGSGTSDYNALSNIPSINGVVVKGNLTANDLKLMSKADINSALETKANKDDVYSKDEIDIDVKLPLGNKADKSYVDTQLLDKANTADVYNKEKVDEKISTSEALLNAKLLGKADAENVYDKANVDRLVKTRANNLSFVNNKLQLISDGSVLGDSVEIKVASSDVVISNEQPENDFKLWVNNGEIEPMASEVVNTLEGNESNKAPSVAIINEMFSPVLLYNNLDGNNSSVTLDDNIENYDYIVIDFMVENNIATHIFQSINGKEISVSESILVPGENYVRNNQYRIDGNVLTLIYSINYHLNVAGYHYDGDISELKITRVLGYKTGLFSEEVVSNEI